MQVKHGGRKMKSKQITIDAWDHKNKKPMRYKPLNELIHKAADSGNKHIIVKNVLGQRFIAACMEHKM